MSASSEPDLPKDPAEYRKRPLMGVGFWAAIALSVLSVLAGAGVAFLLPRLLPARPQPAPPPPAAASPAPGPVATAVPLVASPADPDEVARLKARVAVLESQGARSSEAAAAALAAAVVIEASRSSRPFAAELGRLQAAAPHLPELASLMRLAETGAPSRTALAASFPDYAAQAASRARKPPRDDAGLGDRLVYVASKVVSLRRVSDAAGDSPDARLARAELALQDGDVVAALRALDGLPPKAQKALAPWRAEAERRAAIDREVAALRARALRDLRAAPPEPAA